MKTREEIITSMCLTWRHDFGITKPDSDNKLLSSGMTTKEQKALWLQMAQLFDNNIALHMEFKKTFPNAIA